MPTRTLPIMSSSGAEADTQTAEQTEPAIVNIWDTIAVLFLYT